MAANPYAEDLAGRDARQAMAQTPKRWRALFEQLGREGLQRSLGPGKWTAGQIYCHLADCEIAFGFRLRQALAETNHVVQPFDQDAWAKPYAALEAGQALETFTALRNWNVALLNTLSPEDFRKPLRHPERGDMVFETIVETIAGHDLHHLAQIETIASQPGQAAVR